MRNKYRVHLRGGSTLFIKADEFSLSYDNEGVTKWEAINAKQWVHINPRDIAAVERIS